MKAMRLLAAAALTVSAAAAAITAAPRGADAAPTQFTLFDATMSQTATDYFEPSFTAPPDWTSPVDYAGGRAYWRVDVQTKPSDLAIVAQVCMWRGRWKVETCTRATTGTFQTAGTYWVDLGAPDSWWKKDGNWSWRTPFEATRIMIKDVASKRLLIGTKCGDFCYPRPDLASHVPIRINSQLIVVAKGAQLQPPANWAGCPATWSSACGSPGTNSAPVVSAGPDLTASVGNATALGGSVTDDGLPSNTVTSRWNKVSGPGTVSFSTASAASTSATFSAAGRYTLRLSASDGSLSRADTAVVTVGSTNSTTTTTTAPPPSSVTVSISDATVAEPDSGFKSMPFKVTLSKAASADVAVTVKVTGGTATARTDFDSRGDQVRVVIPAGKLYAWVGFGVRGDLTKEPDETVMVSLVQPSGATLGDAAGRGVIVNDD